MIVVAGQSRRLASDHDHNRRAGAAPAARRGQDGDNFPARAGGRREDVTVRDCNGFA
jgi:hypothetical protein